MLANVFTKSLRDRWLSTVAGMGLIALMLPLAMAAYSEVDVSLYDSLPEALRSVMGIPAGADAAVLAFTVVFGLVGGLTLSGIAVSMGASSVAGEERAGTIGVLLGNPRSRRQVLVAAAGAAAVLLAAGTTVVLVAAVLTPGLLGIDVGDADVAAPTLHLWLNALVWGALATAIGAWTGQRSLASAGAAAAMVMSYFAAGLLPLFEATEPIARWVPWAWLDAHMPLVNGVSGRDAGLQAGAVVLLAVVAWVGVERRDLHSASNGGGLAAGIVDRLRQDPRAAALLDRLSGTARTRNVFVMEASRGQALLVVTSLAMFSVMGVLMGPTYAALETTFVDIGDQFPEGLLAIFGGGDLSTPAGFYRLETFALMAPIATALVGIVVGARALAGEERDRTMGLLLSAPITRRSVVLQKAGALVLHVAVVGLATFIGVAVGVLVASVDLGLDRIAAATLHVTLLGTVFGLLALALGALTGRARGASLGTAGIAVVSYVLNSTLSATGAFPGLLAVSPFDWALGGFPLVNGIEWSSVGVMLLGSLVLLAASVVAFERRDLGRG